MFESGTFNDSPMLRRIPSEDAMAEKGDHASSATTVPEYCATSASTVSPPVSSARVGLLCRW